MRHGVPGVAGPAIERTGVKSETSLGILLAPTLLSSLAARPARKEGADESREWRSGRTEGGDGVRVPWTRMNMFQDDMDRLLDRLFEPRLGGFETLGEWMPKLDLSETKDAYVARLEVPGVGPNGVNVSIRDGLLMITGEKTPEEEKKDAKLHRVERVWGRFARTIPLPGLVDTGKTTATFKEGVLTVTLPKAAASFVPVNAG